MKEPELRIAGETAKDSSSPEPTVRLKLSEVFPLLVHAHSHGNPWLQDLGDDPIVVTVDLAQILHAVSAIIQEKRGA